jgi:hypothetical protein
MNRSTINVLIKELEGTCLNYIKLSNQLEIEEVTEDQKANIMGDIMACVVLLNAQTTSVEEELDVIYEIAE